MCRLRLSEATQDMWSFYIQEQQVLKVEVMPTAWGLARVQWSESIFLKDTSGIKCKSLFRCFFFFYREVTQLHGLYLSFLIWDS